MVGIRLQFERRHLVWCEPTYRLCSPKINCGAMAECSLGQSLLVSASKVQPQVDPSEPANTPRGGGGAPPPPEGAGVVWRQATWGSFRFAVALLRHPRLHSAATPWLAFRSDLSWTLSEGGTPACADESSKLASPLACRQMPFCGNLQHSGGNIAASQLCPRQAVTVQI